MRKFILASALTAAVLALPACSGAEENNVAAENFEDLNASEDMGNLDMNMDANMDMNAVDNAVDNATANESTDSTANSY